MSNYSVNNKIFLALKEQKIIKPSVGTFFIKMIDLAFLYLFTGKYMMYCHKLNTHTH